MSTQQTLSVDQLDDRPELVATIAGREYRFSEVPIAKLADLQSFLRRTVPHPVEAIKPHLAGLAAEDRQALLLAARAEGRNWPPQAGTSAGMAALLSTEAGQLEALAAGLSVHHPELPRAEAARLYRRLQREAIRDAARKGGDGEGIVKRIFSVIFGFGDPDSADDGPIPEA